MIVTCYVCQAELSFPHRGRAAAIRSAAWAKRSDRFYCAPCTSALPLRVRTIINRVKNGQVLCHLGGGIEVDYVLMPSGRRVPRISAREAIASGQLRPRMDGLFGAETSQTWEG